MKQFSAIFLFLLLLIGMFGQSVVYMSQHWQAHIAMEQRLDAENVYQDELFTVKIPMSVPYLANQSFERINGHFELGGKFYTLFKQKIENDTLHLLCVKDYKQQQIFQHLAETIKAIWSEELPNSSPNAAKILSITLQQDYIPSYTLSVATLPLTIREAIDNCFYYNSSLPTVHLLLHSPPPKFIG